MGVLANSTMHLVFGLLFLAGSGIEAWSYNDSASIKCLENSYGPQYLGGLLKNPEFDSGLEGWNVLGMGRIGAGRSSTGNNFILAYNRSSPNDSLTQGIYLQKEIHYTFSAWVQVTEGDEVVVAALSYSRNSRKIIGSVIPQTGCWSMMKGGFVLDIDTRAELYFETNNTKTELWLDSVSLQPFTKRQWRKHQLKRTNKLRKSKLRLHVFNEDGLNIQGAHIILNQIKPSFPLGCGIALTILDNKDYQNWFTSRFTAMTFDNEMKWDFTEQIQGNENYSISDAMFKFAEQNGISVRGHNILWDNIEHNPNWVKPLYGRELINYSIRRMGSVMSRYSGRVIGWDVMNENLHFKFFEDNIRPNASAMFYKIAQALDPETHMFLNEYNTLEYPEDLASIPSKYTRKIQEIRSFPGNEDMVVAIGLQGHFQRPNIPYIRACLDTLGALNLPIWLTELTVDQKTPNQAEYLEELLREVYSHHSVEGIIVWSGWKPTGCREMCLTDNQFKNLPAGDVVDKLIDEWKTKKLEGVTDQNGVFQHRIVKGLYNLTVEHPNTGQIIRMEVSVTSKNTEDIFIQL
ncbi:endo-1,4-beta-xylanase 5-like [Apium graveolens]|uniref:endo-1,4-beta-xylanase 5-like n=1 Tax=Apium graveolens TaxID=4045 RepID=UPI003D7A08CD